jgi:hypothetical protein
MKRIIFATAFALLTALILGGARPSAPPRAAAMTANEAQQQTPQDGQAVTEWDPETQGIGDLRGATQLSPEEAGRPNKTTIPIVGQRFSPDEFLQYVKSNVAPALRGRLSWKPTFIVLHNTAVPSIAQRRNGFTRANMDSLARYYGINQGWRSGPHLFVDQNGIWVFSRLDRRGTHSPCFNARSWGIEQLGDFAVESYDSGDGAKIRDNAVAAMAILSIAGNINRSPQNATNPIRFHKEDRCTNHACPGDHCVKNGVISMVEEAKRTWRRKWDAQ